MKEKRLVPNETMPEDKRPPGAGGETLQRHRSGLGKMDGNWMKRSNLIGDQGS